MEEAGGEAMGKEAEVDADLEEGEIKFGRRNHQEQGRQKMAERFKK